MSGNEEATVTAVHGLADAGKAVADAAGTVAGDRLRAEVVARSSRAAVEVKAFAVAMRASSQSLREQGHQTQADLVDEVAIRADKLAARLTKADTDDLIEDGKRLGTQAAMFARKEPVLVVAGAFTLGLLVPKLLKALADESSTEGEREASDDG